MKFGFRPIQGGNTFENALQQVEMAEHAGFDSAWLTEHHGWDVSWPSPQLGLAAFATQTDSILLGTSIVLLPLANPVRLAGEIAMLDDISDGRAILGVALGYQQREFNALNRSVEGRVTRFVEYCTLIRRLFREEEVSFEGKSYNLTDFTLSPRPTQEDGPPIWCGGNADPALRRAASLGDEWIPTWTRSLSSLRERKDQYVNYLEETGDDPNDRAFPVIRAVITGETEEEAIQRARRSFQPVIEGYLDGGYEMGVDPDSFSDIMDIAEDRFIIGTPTMVCDQLETFIREYGTDHLIMKVHGPGMTHRDVRKTIRLLGDDVLPNLT